MSRSSIGDGACLLSSVAVCKDVLESNVELAHVVFAKAILVPAHSLEQQTRDARDGEVEGLVPFRVQCLVDYRSGFTRVS
jgi:hypothetical protein